MSRTTTLLLLAVLCGSAATGAAPPSQNREPDEPPHARKQQPVYRSTALRSPFEPASSVEPTLAQAAKPDGDRAREPLEHYPLAQLRLVGTLSGRGIAYALFQDPAGEVHPVPVGGRVGTDHGRVEAVQEDAVALVETIQDGAGGWIRRQRSLSLAPPEEPRRSTAGEAAPSPQPNLVGQPNLDRED